MASILFLQQENLTPTVNNTQKFTNRNQSSTIFSYYNNHNVPAHIQHIKIIAMLYLYMLFEQ